ncbi:MAG TPA: SUMF1/EgtB/PvdO family nonheme iron enzyme [archaeon]|nr:SUMF1/EgtB/PvdO family nonheme iron enzyme [archaeon]
MKNKLIRLLILPFLVLLFTCDKDRLPTETELTAKGQIVIVLEEGQSSSELAAARTDSAKISIEKEKDLKQPRLSAVNQLEVRILGSDNTQIATGSFTPADGRFTGTIDVKAQNDLKVLCIGKNSGIAERFVMASGVNVIAGRTTTVSVNLSTWTAGYIPQITSISPNPSTDGSYTVSWRGVTGAASYLLQEAANSGFSGARTAYSGSSLQAAISGKTQGTYYYRIQATNDYNVTSGWSSEEKKVEVTPPPGIPTLYDPGTSVISDTNYTLSWSNVSGATSYTIEEATDNLFNSPTAQTVTGTSQSFSHSVSSTTTYYYRVKANSATGSSEWSNLVDMIVNPLPFGPPPVLSDPGTTVSYGKSYTLNWSSVDGAISYTIEEATESTFASATTQTVTGTSQSFSHSVGSTTTYYYRVKANSATTSSDWSNTVDMIVNSPSVPTLNDPGNSVLSGVSYTLSWSSVSEAISYTIEEATDNSFAGAISQNATGTSKSFSHSVSAPTNYYYRVKANMEGGSSDWSNTVDMLVTLSIPGTPVLKDPGYSAVSDQSYIVSWSKDKWATSYTIEEATEISFQGAVSQTVNDTAQAFSHKVTSRTTYFYRVKANGVTGNSDWSTPVDIIVDVCSPGPELEAPGDSVASGSIFTLNWSQVSGATKYLVEISENASFSTTDTLYSTFLRSLQNRSVQTRTTFYYRVLAVLVSGESCWSNVESVLVYVAIIPVPPVVADPGASINSNSSYTVTWSKPPGATSYTIDEATDISFSGSVSQTVTGTSASFSHSVGTSTTYYYRVKASSVAGSSGWSNIVDMLVKPVIPNKPALNDPGDCIVSGNSFDLTWGSVSGAATYTIEQATNSSFSGASSQTISGTSKSISPNVSATTTYYFRVKANNESGSSDWSNTVDLVAYPSPVPPVVGDPGNSVTSSTSYTVSWGSIIGAVSYTIEEATDRWFGEAASQTLSGTSQSFSHSVSSTTTYYYRVKVNCGAVSSGWSFIVDMIVGPLPPVTEFRAVGGNAQVSLSWTNPSAAGYQGTVIVRKEGSYPVSPTDGTEVYKGAFTNTVDYGLTNGIVYYYSAFTYDPGNNYSSRVTAIGIPFVSGVVTEIFGIKLVAIPGGDFQMGQDGIATPVHTVTLTTFQMSITEITQGQYVRVMGSNPSGFNTGDDNLPVEQVNWKDAATFCNQLSQAAGLEPCYDLSTWRCDFTRSGFRLPTEAEWEYACRAGTRTNYYTGDNAADLLRAAWYSDNSGQATHPVGLKERNAWGLYDMHGNVFEWCNDWFDQNYYTVSSRYDPTGPASGSDRVLRGGSWFNNANFCLSAGRQSYSPDYGYNGLGFRIVRR